MTDFEKSSLTNTILGWEEEHGRDMICAVLADRYAIGDDEHGVSSDELVELVDPNDLEVVKEFLSEELDSIDDDYEYETEELMAVMKDYVCTELDDTPASTPQTATPAPATVAQAPVPTPTPAPATVTAAANAVTTAAPAQPVPAQPAIPQMVVQAAPAMQHVSFVPDNYEEGNFSSYADFRARVTEMEAGETVYTNDEDLQAAGIGFAPTQPTLRIETIENAPIAAGALAQKMKSDPEAVLDTMLDRGGTGLAIRMDNGRSVPIGWSAIPGMCDRAGFTNDGFTRNWKKSSEEAAIGFNRQFGNGKGGVTLLVRGNKLRGMMSRNFAYGKFTDIMNVYEAFKTQKFPNATEQNMYISHTELRWEMNLSAYKTDILSGFTGLYNAGYYPVLQFRTSNTANSAFRIMPALGQTGSDTVVPLCRIEEAISVRHTAPGNYSERVNILMERIVDSFRGCGTMLDSANRNLEGLRSITVVNAYNAVLRTMADCNIPKKQGMEAATAFKNYYGSNPATAFDCFMAIVNAYSYVVRDFPANQEMQFACALNVGKAAGAPWETRGNIPGDFAW